MTKLTNAEEQLMLIIWENGKLSSRQIVELIKENSKTQNTIGTFLTILKSKGFLDRKRIGRVYYYYPIVSQKEYAKYQIEHILKNYFNDEKDSFRNYICEIV